MTVARVTAIPHAVRQHRLFMLGLAEDARAARKRWTDMRRAWMDGKIPQVLDVAAATADLWHAEKKQALGAELLRQMIAENEARPPGERWSRTALEEWVRAAKAARQPKPDTME